MINCKFGKLTVLKTFKGTQGLQAECKCDCGNITTPRVRSLKSGKAASCGCFSKSVSHGKWGTKVYRAWVSMKNRCTNSSYKGFANYGGRGITYDSSWESFENFYKDMGEPTSAEFSLDRIDNDRSYCRTNCRWTNNTVQGNNRRTCTFVEHNGKKITLKELSKILGINYSTLVLRYTKGERNFETLAKKDLRNTVYITYNGITNTYSGWSKITGVKAKTIEYRIKRGWLTERALSL